MKKSSSRCVTYLGRSTPLDVQELTHREHTPIDKISENRKRDKKAIRNLKSAGWNPVVIWECDTRKPERLKRLLTRLIATQSSR